MPPAGAGRFSLNDLHKASGGLDKHRPNYFLENQQTLDLVAEIEKAGIPAIRTKAGRNGGSHAVKELVYRYAMWISPAFELQVIRAYDALATAKRAGSGSATPAAHHLVLAGAWGDCRWPRSVG